MGILDRFKKDESKNEESNNVRKDDFTPEYCQKLLQRIFKDKDHGETMMKLVSLRDNIFVLGYIQNVVLPAVKKENKEQEKLFFETTLIVFKKIFVDKLKRCDKLYKIVSKTTGFPFMENGFAHVLVSDTNIEYMIEQLKKYSYEVEIVEVSKENFKDELKELVRIGYKGVLFSDGKIQPYALTVDEFISAKDFDNPEEVINPLTQYSMISFFQEVRRMVKYENSDKIKANLENMMIYYIVNTKFIVPIRKVAGDKYDSPIYIINEEYDKNIEPGLYVFTDKEEMKSLEEKGIKESEGWKVQVYDFTQIMKIVESQHLSEICINYSSICFRLNRNSLNVLKEESKKILKKSDDEKLKEEWETTELPKMLRDKSVPLIKDTNGKVLFKREKDIFEMSTYIMNILSKRDNFDSALDFLFDDDDIRRISFYDINDKKIILNINEERDNEDTFIMAMRYSDELEKESIDDTKMHYTKDACRVRFNDADYEKAEKNEKAMNFFTIVNHDNNKTYLPLFTSEEEMKELFPRDKFRYCTVSYDDAKAQAGQYEGIVINPLSMSVPLKNRHLNKTRHIEIE